jgi:uncharacterized protein
MIIILSPAKRVDFAGETLIGTFSNVEFLEQTQVLADAAKKLSAGHLQNLMGISDKLAELNYQRYQDFKTPFDLSNARQAVLAFRGDAYLGLDVDSLSDDELAFAQDHLQILSGLYGLLRPMDLIQAYRLEMGTKFKNPRGRDLYAYWKETLTGALGDQLRADDGVLVNLASKEYSSVLDMPALDARIITPQFKEIRDGRPRVMSFFAKKARGMMSRYIIKNRLSDPEAIKDFAEDDYCFNPALSDGDTFVFSRG